MHCVAVTQLPPIVKLFWFMMEKSYAKILNLVCEAPRLWRTQSCVLTFHPPTSCPLDRPSPAKSWWWCFFWAADMIKAAVSNVESLMSRCDAGKYHCGGSGSSYTSEEQSKYNKNLNVVRCSSCFFIQDLGSLVVRTADSWLDNTFNQPITR